MGSSKPKPRKAGDPGREHRDEPSPPRPKPGEPDPKREEDSKREEERLDEAIDESFPASDPPAHR